MEKTSKKELLRKILAGEVMLENLLPDTIVVLNDEKGNKLNPKTGKVYPGYALKAAKTILELPVNGRESFQNNLQ